MVVLYLRMPYFASGSAFQHSYKNSDMLRYKWDELSKEWNRRCTLHRLLIISTTLFAIGQFGVDAG